MEKVKSFGTAGCDASRGAVRVAWAVNGGEVLAAVRESPSGEDDEESDIGTVLAFFVVTTAVRFTVMVAAAFVFVMEGG
jgi:hypothetical protein